MKIELEIYFDEEVWAEIIEAGFIGPAFERYSTFIKIHYLMPFIEKQAYRNLKRLTTSFKVDEEASH